MIFFKSFYCIHANCIAPSCHTTFSLLTETILVLFLLNIIHPNITFNKIFPSLFLCQLSFKLNVFLNSNVSLARWPRKRNHWLSFLILWINCPRTTTPIDSTGCHGSCRLMCVSLCPSLLVSSDFLENCKK